jgi:hypothetical protein
VGGGAVARFAESSAVTATRRFVFLCLSALLFLPIVDRISQGFGLARGQHVQIALQVALAGDVLEHGAVGVTAVLVEAHQGAVGPFVSGFGFDELFVELCGGLYKPCGLA